MSIVALVTDGGVLLRLWIGAIGGRTQPHGEENAADALYRLCSARPHSRRDRGRQARNDQRYCGKVRYLTAAFDEGRERSQSEGLSRYRARSWRRHSPASPAARHQYRPSVARDRGQARCYRLSGAARLLPDRARLRVAWSVARCDSGVSRCLGRIYTGRSDQAAEGLVVVVAARSARGAWPITDSPAAIARPPAPVRSSQRQASALAIRRKDLSLALVDGQGFRT